eukprot:7506645-Ditylum_brightwellii.AAC.1
MYGCTAGTSFHLLSQHRTEICILGYFGVDMKQNDCAWMTESHDVTSSLPLLMEEEVSGGGVGGIHLLPMVLSSVDSVVVSAPASLPIPISPLTPM